jgi:hypothetical protein
VHRTQGYDFEDEQVEGALDEIGRFAQEPLLSVTDNRIHGYDVWMQAFGGAERE